jgi:hypothetical protein
MFLLLGVEVIMNHDLNHFPLVLVLSRELDNPKSKLDKKQRAILVEIYDHVGRLHSRYTEVVMNCEELVTEINAGSKQIHSLLSPPYNSTASLRSSLKEAATISQSLALKTEKLPPLYTELMYAIQTFRLLISEKKREVEEMNRSSSRSRDKFLGCIKLALKVLAVLVIVAGVVAGAVALASGSSSVAEFGIAMLPGGVKLADKTGELWNKVESFTNRGMYLRLAGMQYCTGTDILPYE